MNIVKSFPPISEISAQILILGSMPGSASLQANQYYAHPRNAFWPILASIYGFDASSEYRNRVQSLIAAKIAVWDVLHTCERAGSLDSAIVKDSRISNNIQVFLTQHPNIERIAFNGAEAEKSFTQFVMSKIEAKHLSFIRLTSSSPANTKALEQKTLEWKAALISK